MNVYTLAEASRLTKIPVETLRRACKEELIKAIHLPNNQVRIEESALLAALSAGIKFSAPSRKESKQPQPEGLRKAAERRRKSKDENS